MLKKIIFFICLLSQTVVYSQTSSLGHSNSNVIIVSATLNDLQFLEVNQRPYNLKNTNNTWTCTIAEGKQMKFGLKILKISKGVTFGDQITNIKLQKIDGTKTTECYYSPSISSDEAQSIFVYNSFTEGIYTISYNFSYTYKQTYNPCYVSYQIEVKTPPSLNFNNHQTICSGEKIDWSFKVDKNVVGSWYLNGQLIDTQNENPSTNRTYDLLVTDNLTKLTSQAKLDVVVISKPTIPIAPTIDYSQCGKVILSYSSPNMNYHFGESCAIAQKTPPTLSYEVNSNKTIYISSVIQASNSLKQCWSECISIPITLSNTIPSLPIVTDQMPCLCTEPEVTLVAQNPDPNPATEIRWYESENSSSLLSKGSTYMVPSEEQNYYVSIYNTHTSCESSRIPVQIFPVPCTSCISEFSPLPGKKYILSAWVKETNTINSMNYAFINLSFEGTQVQIGPFKAKGPVIEGWQKIEEQFTIPVGATVLYLDLNNGRSNASSATASEVYFDDIRVHPFDSNMKSYVYDPQTMRLVADLDENNFATYYSYDAEGNVVSVNKETIEGVKTIKETRTIPIRK